MICECHRFELSHAVGLVELSIFGEVKDENFACNFLTVIICPLTTRVMQIIMVHEITNSQQLHIRGIVVSADVDVKVKFVHLLM